MPAAATATSARATWRRSIPISAAAAAPSPTTNGYYHFRTVKPGAYPWPNGGNDWRPAHIHFSVFGHAFAQRLITQMYFEGDPMIWQDPIALAIPDRAAVEQLIARLDRHNTTPMDALAYRFDIVLRGRRSTMFENRPEGN